MKRKWETHKLKNKTNTNSFLFTADLKCSSQFKNRVLNKVKLSKHCLVREREMDLLRKQGSGRKSKVKVS